MKRRLADKRAKPRTENVRLNSQDTFRTFSGLPTAWWTSLLSSHLGNLSTHSLYYPMWTTPSLYFFSQNIHCKELVQITWGSKTHMPFAYQPDVTFLIQSPYKLGVPGTAIGPEIQFLPICYGNSWLLADIRPLRINIAFLRLPCYWDLQKMCPLPWSPLWFMYLKGDFTLLWTLKGFYLHLC